MAFFAALSGEIFATGKQDINGIYGILWQLGRRNSPKVTDGVELTVENDTKSCDA